MGSCCRVMLIESSAEAESVLSVVSPLATVGFTLRENCRPLSGSDDSLPLRLLEVTFPGVSHFNLFGSEAPYPGQSTPSFRHLLQVGRVKSQTRQRRRHSQQCCFGFDSIDPIAAPECGSQNICEIVRGRAGASCSRVEMRRPSDVASGPPWPSLEPCAYCYQLVRLSSSTGARVI